MAELTISQVARQVGARPSAIRYYEQIGILAPPERRSGQRRYGENAVYRLALILRARELGFSLDEIRQLCFGFPDGTPMSRRWRELCRKKLLDLAAQAQRIEGMQAVLRCLQRRCRCRELDECGRAVFLAAGR